MTSNTTISIAPDVTEAQLSVVKTFTISTAILGTLGNSLTVMAILRGQLYKNASFLFILNLSVCNLLHCLVLHPLLAAQAFKGVWTNNTSLCNAYSYILFSTMGAELWGYVCITLNRYFCVVRHDLYPRIYGNSRILAGSVAFSWMFYPTLFLFPLLGLWGHFEYVPQKLVCHPFNEYDCNGFCLFLYIVAVTSTVPIIVFCYSSIIYTYIRSQKKVGLSRERSTKSETNDINRIKSDCDRKRSMSELKMAFTILAVTVVFAGCRLPFMILYLYDPSMSKVDPLVHTVLIYIGSNSDWINPLIYAFTNRQISNSLCKTFVTWKATIVINTTPATSR